MRFTQLAIASVLVAAPIASASAHPHGRMHNRALFRAHVTVWYKGCDRNQIGVPAASQNKDGTIVAGAASGPMVNPNCLITSIAATLVGSSSKVTSYSGNGTRARGFTIVSTASEVRIYLDAEVPR